MKRLIRLILTTFILLCIFPAAYAADYDDTEAAEKLHVLGLFNGVGTNEDGTPNYDLDRAPTRAEAITMLVHLLGMDDEAKAGSWDTPFTDVADWAKPYVGYAFANGLTSGTGPTTFGSKKVITASQYLTFVLKALGYDSNTDFKWNAAQELSNEIGLTDVTDNNSSGFFRGDVARISYNALSVAQKGSETTLAEKLIEEGSITVDNYDKVLDPAFTAVLPDYSHFSFTYLPETDSYAITDYKYDHTKMIATDSGPLIIPDTYEGKPVTEISTKIYSNAEYIYIPASITRLLNVAGTYNSFSGIHRCSEFRVAADNPAFCAVDGVLMTKDKTTILRYPPNKSGDIYVIPDYVTTIGANAFRYAGYMEYHDLKTIVIHKNVNTVYRFAFYLCTAMLEMDGNTDGWDHEAMEWSAVSVNAMPISSTKQCAVSVYECASWLDPVDAPPLRVEYTLLEHGMYLVTVHFELPADIYSMYDMHATLNCRMGYNVYEGSNTYTYYTTKSAFEDYWEGVVIHTDSGDWDNIFVLYQLLPDFEGKPYRRTYTAITTDGIPIGTPWNVSWQFGSGCTIPEQYECYGIIAQQLDNGYLRITMDYQCPEGFSISAFDPPDGDSFMLISGTDSGDRESISFDIPIDRLEKSGDLMCIKFYGDRTHSESEFQNIILKMSSVLSGR